MDFDDEHTSRRELGPDVSVPPEDWTGFTRNAGMEAIYSAHQPALTRYLRRRAPRQDIGDLVQECFRRLFTRKGPASETIAEPGAYLVRIARNLLIDRARTAEARQHAAHHSFDEQDVAGPDPHAALEARDAMRRIQQAIARLKPQTRGIFLMHRFDDLSYEEIAAAKGISVKGVEWHIAQAMIAIRKARTDRK
ncbi:RNA polymerase sigma factor [Sphingopyxis witflariensis]|nr:sigma-70 family RNA polymerase sigma factor [Sphingopyxis witflariensis]